MKQDFSFWILVFVLTLVCFVSAQYAKGDSNAGVGLYAIQSPRFRCDAAFKAFEGVPTIRISYLHHTFGRDNRCLERFLADRRTKLVEVHLVNATCQRNRRCGPYELLAGISSDREKQLLKSADRPFLDKVRANAREAADFLSPRLRDDVACYVSPELESNLDPQSAQVLIDTVRPIFPKCRTVWNPVGRGEQAGFFIPGTVNESHGVRPRLRTPCISNLDGVDIDFHAFPAVLPQRVSQDDLPRWFERYRACEAAFLWTAGQNCIGKGPFVDPRRRTACAGDQVYRLLNKVLREAHQPSAPVPPPSDEDQEAKKQCRRIHPTMDGAGGYLWKPVSDTRPAAVTLFPGRFKNKFNAVEIVKGKKVLERLYFSGHGNPDPDGDRQHWRSTRKGSSFPKNILVKAEGHCWPVPDPARRWE